MYGIVTILEGEEGKVIERLWAHLAETHGAETIAGYNVPHFSYHVALNYDLAAVERLLRDVARRTEAFEVATVGLSCMVSPAALTFINVTRTPGLERLHAALWHGATKAGSGVMDYYQVDRWFPHVTLGEAPVLHETVSDISRRLFVESEALATVTVDNLAVIEELSHGHEIRLRVGLS